MALTAFNEVYFSSAHNRVVVKLTKIASDENQAWSRNGHFLVTINIER